MPQTEVIIGPFRRRMFTEGLAVLLGEEPGLTVRLIENEADAAAYLDAASSTIVILESREEEDRRAFLPVSDAVAVILIAQEGKDVQIALRQIDRSHLREVIGLVAETPHPKVVALDTDAPAQPPFALPKFREANASGLSWVLAWLDAAFACALDDFARQRGGQTGAAWMQDLDYLRDAFARGGEVSRAEEEQRFNALVDTPMWQVRLFRTFTLDRRNLS